MEYGTGRYVTMYTVPVRGRARRLRGRDGLSLRRPTVARRPPCHVARSRTVVLCVPLFDTDYNTLSPRTIVLYNNYTGHTRYTTRLYWLSWPSKYQYRYPCSRNLRRSCGRGAAAKRPPIPAARRDLTLDEWYNARLSRCLQYPNFRVLCTLPDDGNN